MLPLSPGALLTLVIVAGTAGAAERPRAPECSKVPRVDLTAEPAEQMPGVCVNLDAPTTFVFGATLPSGAVVLSDNRSVDFAQGGAFVTVYPKRSFLPGERVKLTVRFADGEAPEEGAFWLVGHSEKGARSVEVFRQARSADALLREVAEARADARQCQEEKVQLVAERAEPGALMGAAWLERTGEIRSKDIFNGLKQHPDNALTVQGAKSYSHLGGIAVRLRLLNTGAEPWVVASAVLIDSMGVEVVLSTWQGAAIQPNDFGFLVVGTQMIKEFFACPCSLKLKETQGIRPLVFGGITTPSSQ